MLHRSFDEVRFVNLGRRGNRVELRKHLAPRRRQGASARGRAPQDPGGFRRIRGCSTGDPDDAARGVLRALALRLPFLRLQLRLGLHLLSGQDQGSAGEGSYALLRRGNAGGRVRGASGRHRGERRLAGRGGRAGGRGPPVSGAPSLPEDEDLHGGAGEGRRHVRALQRGDRRPPVQPEGKPAARRQGDGVPARLHPGLRLVQADRRGEGGTARVRRALLHARKRRAGAGDLPPRPLPGRGHARRRAQRAAACDRRGPGAGATTLQDQRRGAPGPQPRVRAGRGARARPDGAGPSPPAGPLPAPRGLRLRGPAPLPSRDARRRGRAGETSGSSSVGSSPKPTPEAETSSDCST